MNTNTPSLIHFLTHTTGSTELLNDGELKSIPDNELLKYRLFDIPTDNFSAFLFNMKHAENLANSMSDSMTPTLSNQIKRNIAKLTKQYIVSLTGKSAENAALMKMLLQDESRQYHYIKGIEKAGVLDRIRGVQGQPEQPPPQMER